MRLSRREFNLAAVGTAAVGLVRYPAGAAEFTYKLAGENPSENPITIRALEAAARTLRDSNGRLEIRVFPNNALGAESQVYSLVHLGAVEFGIHGDSVMESVVPVIGILSVPLSFASHRDAIRAANGPLGKYVQAAINSAGVYALEGTWDTGMRQVANSLRPVRVPGDLKGMRFRLAPSPVITSFFSALGVSPVFVNIVEVYPALQTHLIDGVESPLVNIQGRKMHEIAKNISLTNHTWTSLHMIANADAWQKLPKDLRDVCERNFNQASAQVAQDQLRLDASLEALVTSQGAAINQVDLPSFRAAIKAQGLYTQWREHYGAQAWAMLERAVGPLR